jgi:hypothetical protein
MQEPSLQLHCTGQSSATLQVSGMFEQAWSTQVSRVQKLSSLQSLLTTHSTHVFAASSQTSPPPQSASLPHSTQTPLMHTSPGSQIAQGSVELLQKEKVLQTTLHPTGQSAVVLQEMGVLIQISSAQESSVQASWSLQSASPSHVPTVSHVPSMHTSFGSQVTPAQGSVELQPFAKIARTPHKKIRTGNECMIWLLPNSIAI